MADPIFILGTERSGSNLLRLILNAHSQIVVPHPPHILHYFAPLLANYGDLADDRRFRALVHDVHALVGAHIHPWDWIPSREEVFVNSKTRTLFAVYAAIHESLRQHGGKARWGCKSTFMVDHVAEVRSAFPNARFLWLFRDPRDVAASSKESVFSTFHPSFSAKLWVDQQTKALQAEPEGGVLRMRYEDLVAEPEEAVRRLCSFLDEPFEPTMLRWFEDREARKSADLSESWKNTAAPMQSDRLARYRRDLSPEEIGAVESIAGPVMTRLGYPLDGPPLPALSPLGEWLRRGRWRFLDAWLWLKVELRSLRRDRNVRRRWSRSWLMRRIKARGPFRAL